MFLLATKAGAVNPCMTASSLMRVPPSICHESIGLHGLLDNNMAMLKDGEGNWKKRPLRTHASAASKTGGQDMIRCGCTGKCDTRSCSCKKANRECNSRCHKNNTTCVNQQCRE